MQLVPPFCWNLFVFDNLSPIFLGNHNICIATVAGPFEEKSNPICTRFELKLNSNSFNSNYVFLYWNDKNVPVSNFKLYSPCQCSYLKKIIADMGPCCSLAYTSSSHIVYCIGILYYISFVQTGEPKTKATGSEGLLQVLFCKVRS